MPNILISLNNLIFQSVNAVARVKVERRVNGCTPDCHKRNYAKEKAAMKRYGTSE